MLLGRFWDWFGFRPENIIKTNTTWLKPNGCALIAIYTPWFWAKVAGQEMQIVKNVIRKYDFDAMNCRMLDSWWKKENLSEIITQSLRCYSPADFKLLINDLILKLVHCKPGVAMDYKKWIF